MSFLLYVFVQVATPGSWALVFNRGTAPSTASSVRTHRKKPVGTACVLRAPGKGTPRGVLHGLETGGRLSKPKPLKDVFLHVEDLTAAAAADPQQCLCC